MPPKGKAIKKRNYKRKRSYKKRGVRTVPRWTFNAGSAIVQPCKLTYCETITLGGGGISQGYTGTCYEWNLNSLYDPNATGSGHQVYGFDQLTNFFRRYCVTGCHVELIFSNPSHDGQYVAWRAVASGESAASMTGLYMDVIWEQNRGECAPLNNTGSQVKKISRYYDIAKLENTTRLKITTDDQYSSNVTTNPYLMPRIQVATLNNSVTDATSCMVTAKLTYYCMFMEPKVLPQS